MSGGPSGFQNAPVTRALLVTSAVLSVISAARGRPSSSALSHEDIFKSFRIWKVLASRLAFSSTPELLFGLYLLYYFRVFERQIGSNKYSVFVLFSMLVSLLLEVLTLTLPKDSTSRILASGPYGVVFSSFVPFFFDIPVSSRMQIFGFRVSDKSFTYLAGLQLLLSSWKRSLLPGIYGMIAGLLHRSNLFGIRHARLPNFVVSFLSRLFPPTTGSTRRSSRGSIGRDLSSFNAHNQATFAAPTNVEPHEDLIAVLVSMGFDTDSARQALIGARNDINVATNILLEAQTR